MLQLSPPEAMALVTGEIVVGFADRGAVNEGDEVAIAATTTASADDIKPAYRRWLGSTPPDGYGGVIISVEPVAILDSEAGSARHLRSSAPPGDLVVIRVYGPDGPVLSDAAFAARQKSVEGALRG